MRKEALGATSERTTVTLHYPSFFPKYIYAGLLFLPFAVDCFGVLTPSARSTLKRIAAALEISRGYPTYLAKQIVFRRVSFAIHLGTIRQVLACQPTQSTYPSSSSLPIIPFSQRVCLNSSTHPSISSPLPLSSCVVPSSWFVCVVAVLVWGMLLLCNI